MGVPHVDDLLQLGNRALVGREFGAAPLVQAKAWRGRAEHVREEQWWVLLAWREGSVEGTERNKVGRPCVPGQERGGSRKFCLFPCRHRELWKAFLLW